MKEVQLKPRKKRNFIEWFILRKIFSHVVRTMFTVPPHISYLPCGCIREETDKPFLVGLRDGHWVHFKSYTDVCQLKIMEDESNCGGWIDGILS